MSFQLKRKESVAAGLQRIARDEFDTVEANLRALGSDDGRSRAVHETRKHLKILRSLHRFWRESLTEGDYDRQASRLREMAHEFSRARDVDARLATLRSIGEETSPPGGDAVAQIVHQWTAKR